MADKWFGIIVVILVIIGGMAFYLGNHGKISLMTITSPAFANNGTIPIKYTCDGEKINPPLNFGNIPALAKSLNLLVDDPDAPGRTFVHLNLKDIPATTTEIREGELSQWIPPCPPSGTHRYFFKLSALDASGQVVAQGQLIGLYSRR